MRKRNETRDLHINQLNEEYRKLTDISIGNLERMKTEYNAIDPEQAFLKSQKSWEIKKVKDDLVIYKNLHEYKISNLRNKR